MSNDLKRKRENEDDNEETSIKNERNITVKREKGDLKTEKLMQSIIDSDDYNEFCKDQCRRRLHLSSKFKFFQSIKNDLNEMIRKKELFLFSHTAILEGNKRDKNKPILQFSITGKNNKNNIHNKFNLSKQMEKDQTEEKFQPWFQQISNCLKTECEAFNKIELNEIRKLCNELEVICSEKFDKQTEDQLIAADIVSPLTVQNILTEYKEKENPQIIDWLDRRIEFTYKPNQIFIDIISELDQMISKNDIAVPCFMSFTKSNNDQQLAFTKKQQGKTCAKMITTKIDDFDKFECFRCIELLFEWFKKISLEMLGVSDLEQQELENKINQIKEIVNND